MGKNAPTKNVLLVLKYLKLIQVSVQTSWADGRELQRTSQGRDTRGWRREGKESRLWAAETSFQVGKHEGKAWTSRTQEKFSKGGDSFPSCLLSVPEF